MKDICKGNLGVKLEEEVLLDANGDTSFISVDMVAEEEKLLEDRMKEEVDELKEAPQLDDSQFTKLDELLTQTQLYSEFLLEKMDDITKVSFYTFFQMCILGTVALQYLVGLSVIKYSNELHC